MPIVDIEIADVFIPGLSHELQDLLPGILGGCLDGISHRPGQPAGYGLPLVWTVFRIHRPGDANGLVGRAERLGRDLGRYGKCSLAQFLPPYAYAQGTILVEAGPGLRAGVWRHGRRFPHDGEALATPLVWR